MPNNAAPDPSEFYKKCFEIENNLTRNILKAIPPGKLDYRPHERSRSTGQIAWTIARGLYARVDMVSPCFSHVIGIPIQPWRKYSGASRIRPVATLHNWTPSRRDMDKVGQLPSGDRIALGGAASDIVWLFHIDEIHHRGQVPTYLRPMGARVPSTYGASGDSGLPERDISNSPNKRPANAS